MEGRDSPRDRLAESIGFSHVSSERTVGGDVPARHEQKPEFGIAKHSCRLVDESDHGPLRNEEVSILDQFNIETRGTIGALQRLLPELNSYECGQTLQYVAGDHRDCGYLKVLLN
ncbi:hypothetical protein MesoLjLb_09850 [Mesorhizobium sp. L-8-3]|nr:hypothetical protein MesoLjLb_09850 [Mesorhizobium sp. L-8-3]